MRTFEGWVFPDREDHLPQWMRQVNQKRHGRLSYQLHKYLKALEYVTDTRRAIDVGAHVGLWTFQMAHDFAHVEAFEPMPDHQECWKLNIPASIGDTHLYGYALGDESGDVAIRTRTANSSGDTGVEPSGEGVEVPMRRLDEFAFEDVDFLKVDCEGYEVFVLQGAKETLKRCKPVCIVEQKPETGGPERYGVGETDAVKFLESLGAVKRDGIQGDYILSW